MHEHEEAATFATELAVTIAYAAILDRMKRRYEPHWTWLTVAIGVLISCAPAISLARRAPGDWRVYERRVAIGFLASGAIIIPWQIYRAAIAWGEERGYQRSRPYDQISTLE